MTGQLHQPDELSRLLTGLIDGGLDGAERLRLVELLRSDPAARTHYLRYMLTDAALRLEHAAPLPAIHSERGLGTGTAATRWSLPIEEARGQRSEVSESEISKSQIPNQQPLSAEPLAPPIIIDTSAPASSPPYSAVFAPGGWLFSYAAATAITAVMLLVLWGWNLSHDSAGQVAGLEGSQRSEVRDQRSEIPNPKSQIPSPKSTEPVGRITGMADCRWANPQDTPPAVVALGRKYELASGLMEIAYDSGAKVILQGPCVYEVESAAGGYLSLGKLTARVDTKGEGGRRKTEEDRSQKSDVRGQDSPFPLPPSPFVVRTPTAVVTDLGTEFGVEVDRSDVTRCHVFRGRVELRAGGGADGDSQPILLGENESARVERGKDQVVKVAKIARGEFRSDTFARQISRRVPIKVFSTGIGLKAGDADPHWQIVARSDAPHFKPRQAVVCSMDKYGQHYLANDPVRSQWISVANSASELPDSVTYTFRTTFVVEGLMPESAVLKGRFMADDKVKAIRLNGRSVPVPEESAAGTGPFLWFDGFTTAGGFVDGTNTLDVDVYNGSPVNVGPVSNMLLRVELEGSYVGGRRSPPDRGKEVSP